MKTGWILAVGALALAAPTLAQTQDGGRVVSARKMVVRGIVQKLSDDSGRIVLADASVAALEASALEQAITAEGLEEYLSGLVKTLPRGVVWTRVLLPAPEPGRKFTAEAVLQMVRAQTGLYGKTNAVRPGTIEILGRRYPEAEAEAAIKALGLVPVYVLTNPTAPRPGFATAGGPGAPGGAGGNPTMDALMKQLGVKSPRDIPSGVYKVPFVTPDGNTVMSKVTIENSGGNMKVGVEVGGDKP